LLVSRPLTELFSELAGVFLIGTLCLIIGAVVAWLYVLVSMINSLG